MCVKMNSRIITKNHAADMSHNDHVDSEEVKIMSDCCPSITIKAS